MDVKRFGLGFEVLGINRHGNEVGQHAGANSRRCAAGCGVNTYRRWLASGASSGMSMNRWRPRAEPRWRCALRRSAPVWRTDLGLRSWKVRSANHCETHEQKEWMRRNRGDGATLRRGANRDAEQYARRRLPSLLSRLPPGEKRCGDSVYDVMSPTGSHAISHIHNHRRMVAVHVITHNIAIIFAA